MPITIKKRENETVNSLIFRFNKRIRQSGVLKEARKRRFRDRPQNKRAKKESTLYRLEKRREIERKKKFGIL